MSFIKQSSYTIGRGVLVALAIIIGSLAIAAPSQAQAATYEMQPVRLIAHDIEDWWPDWLDEARLYYGNTSGWAGSVKSGQVVQGNELPRAQFTGTQMRVDLKENDRGIDYPLGEATVTPVLNEEQSVRFGGWGFSFYYELRYVVRQIA